MSEPFTIRAATLASGTWTEALLADSPVPEHPSRGALPANALVVDDDADVRDAIGAMLAELGIEDVRVAHDGEQALAALKGTQWDLMLLDLLMPRLDGFGVLNALREDREDQVLVRPRRVVVMSAHVRTTAASAVRTLGANDLLVKPFEIEDLAVRIGVET